MHNRVSCQTNSDYTQSRILILLDESSSMLDSWDHSIPKYKRADTLIMRLMDSIYAVNNQVQFSLRVFGHQHTVQENNCEDTKNEVPFSRDNKAQMTFRLSDIHPLGVTPLTYALMQAAENDLPDETHNAYSIVLITDGGESCGGNICEVMKNLVKAKVYFKPYIVSLEDYPGLKEEYSCMGNYLLVTHKEDINKAINTIVDAFRPMLNITKKDYTEIKKIASQKTEIAVDDYSYKSQKTVKPEPVKIPEIKKPDTVSTKKIIKTSHSIVVGDQPERPAPVSITKLKTEGYNYIFTKYSNKLRISQVDVPELPKIKIERPEPQKITSFNLLSYTDLEVKTKHKIKFNKSFLPEMPELKLEKPESTPMQAISHLTYTDIQMKPYKNLKFSNDFQPEMPVLHFEKPASTPLSKSNQQPLAEIPINNKTKIKFNTSFHPNLPEVKYEKPASSPVSKISHSNYSEFTTLSRVRINFNKSFHPEIPEIKPDKFEKPAATHFSKMNNTAPVELQKTSIPTIKFKKYKTPAMPNMVFYDEVVMPDKIAAEKITPLKLRPYLTLWSADKYLTKQKIPQLPIFKTLLNPIKPAAPESIKTLSEDKGDYRLEKEDDKETSLAIYFTNGKGKYFSTSPLIKLVDPNDNKTVKEFFRTCDGNGIPDPQNNIPAGKYNLVISRKSKMMMKNIEIVQNKRNKVIIKVNPCSLTFEYAGAPNRPVKEFSAVVTERNVPNGKIINQKCTEELQYGPANYHIVVNTLPEMVFNVDLDFDEEKPLIIYQPGFAKFTTDLKIPRIKLYVQQDDKFLNFYSLDMNDPNKNHFQLEPGTYQAYYDKGPSGYSSSQKVVNFTIMSNEETEVILK